MRTRDSRQPVPIVYRRPARPGDGVGFPARLHLTPREKWGAFRRLLSRSAIMRYLDYRLRAKLHMHYRRRGEPELRILKRLVDPTRASIDVGANKGVYTFWLEKLSKFVYAYEPNPTLVRTFLSGARGRVEVRPFAISNVDRAATLCVTLVSAPDGRVGYLEHQGGSLSAKRVGEVYAEYPVAAHRLDSLPHQPVGFIKIDAEAHELAVLDGARQLIARDRPTLMIELLQACHDRPLAEVIREIEALGYAAHVLLPSGLTPYGDAPPSHFDQRDDDPAFVDNFIFLPTPR